jgi:hypothetical protein
LSPFNHFTVPCAIVTFSARDLATGHHRPRPPASRTAAATPGSSGLVCQLRCGSAQQIERSGHRYRRPHRRHGLGKELAYQKVLIATAGQNRQLAIPGADLPRIGYPRTVADRDAIRQQAAKMNNGGSPGWLSAGLARLARAPAP